MLSRTAIAVDTYDAAGFAGSVDSFHWCTPHEAYRAMASAQFAAILAAWRALDSESDLAKAFAAKLSYINHDLVRIGCLAIDAANIAAAGRTPSYDPARNPVFHYLYSGETVAGLELARNDWPQKARSHAGLAAFTAMAKVVLRAGQGWVQSPGTRIDVVSRNELADQFLLGSGMRKRNLFAYMLETRRAGALDAPLAELALRISAAFSAVMDAWLGTADPALRRRVADGAARVTRAHLFRAWRDLQRLRRSAFLQRPATSLVSGTPKYMGRLLSACYRERESVVHRFAHGGERAFFDDPEWGPNEFTYCDVYHCFSRGEAANTTRRLAEGRVPTIGAAPQFASAGSMRHRGIFESSASGGRPREKSILYVPNKYSGEHLYLAPYFRINDVLYAEWQVWLLRCLRDAGYSVTLKLHPAETAHSVAMLAGLADSVDAKPFDATRTTAACVLFDFAGTAFFDALASRQGVVLIDSGVRPFDPLARRDLDSRVAVVPSYQDERNCFRVVPSVLFDAIGAAAESRGCTAEFFETYYCSLAT